MKSKPIRRFTYGGTDSASIDRHGTASSWRIWFDNADEAVIIDGLTKTQLLELARQINRTVKETKEA
ncbi:hypothetical protein [Bifidobacterium aerophilum]|uniref:Uncharacterized protein n=1 Tax=Bifidobacterium aerophilum TaxID=1798155 RepID=A0A6N9Z610_9BIFI|nr:hypothetical protein [Bifidobacterium aerophilum]NEG89794.1 hypothetical protein [Bifidobacterium aerophilum]